MLRHRGGGATTTAHRQPRNNFEFRAHSTAQHELHTTRPNVVRFVTSASVQDTRPFFLLHSLMRRDIERATFISITNCSSPQFKTRALERAEHERMSQGRRVPTNNAHMEPSRRPRDDVQGGKVFFTSRHWSPVEVSQKRSVPRKMPA